MNSTRKSSPNKYCLIIPGRGYAHTAEHAKQYKEKIKRIAQKSIPKPFNREVDVRLEYLYRNREESKGRSAQTTLIEETQYGKK